MLTSIGRLAARLADLAEAEGRLLREHLIMLSVAGGLLLLALSLLLVGTLMLLVAIYLALVIVMAPPLALALCGLITLLTAFLFLWNAGRQVSR